MLEDLVNIRLRPEMLRTYTQKRQCKRRRKETEKLWLLFCLIFIFHFIVVYLYESSQVALNLSTLLMWMCQMIIGFTFV